MKPRLLPPKHSPRFPFSPYIPRGTFLSTTRLQTPNRVYDPIRSTSDFDSLNLLSASSRQPLITLWTASWCPSCRVVLPIIRDAIDHGVGESQGGVGFAEVHVDAPDVGDLGLRYFINSIPTLLSFSKQEPQLQSMVSKVEELKDKGFLRTWIEEEARKGGAGGGGGLFQGLFGVDKGR